MLTVDIAYNVEHNLSCKAVYDTFSNAHHEPPDAIVRQVPSNSFKLPVNRGNRLQCIGKYSFTAGMQLVSASLLSM